jgi:hypothetical protein
MTVAEHKVRAGESAEAFKPVPAGASHVHPQYDREAGAANDRREKNAHPWLVTDDDVERFAPQQLPQRSSRSKHLVWTTHPHRWQTMRTTAQELELRAEATFETDRELRFHVGRRRRFAQEGGEKGLHPSVHVSTCEMENAHQ